MTGELKVKCTCCERVNTVRPDDIAGLDALIEKERDEEADDARAEYGADEDDMLDAETLVRGDRPLFELSAALRAGRNVDAEYWLDKIAAHIGQNATEAVQQGRYSLRAAA